MIPQVDGSDYTTFVKSTIIEPWDTFPLKSWVWNKGVILEDWLNTTSPNKGALTSKLYN